MHLLTSIWDCCNAYPPTTEAVTGLKFVFVNSLTVVLAFITIDGYQIDTIKGEHWNFACKWFRLSCVSEQTEFKLLPRLLLLPLKIQDTRYKIFYLSCCVYNYTHIRLFTYEIWYMWYIWYIHIKLSNYAILHFLMNIEIRFPIFTSSLDFNNCINLNMLGFCK